ncbi:AMP-binding protein [Algivirga pacifica]|uniref:AMP-binding protein n=1 Tax=Algivirga pacifica TaxID=1162670 RepID=A0ABP9DAR2_9BACT
MKHLVNLIEGSIRNNWDIEALQDYGGESYAYKDVAEQAIKFHQIFENLGIKKGDKVALLGKNSANWAMAYILTVTYGAVIVPVLPDFKPGDAHHIINHSDAKILFADKVIYDKLEFDKMFNLEVVFTLKDFNVLDQRVKDFDAKWSAAAQALEPIMNRGITPDDFKVKEVQANDLTVISYTSGTTGFSKGVMLSQESLTNNVLYAQKHMPLNPGDKIVSFLPLAHAYGCAFEFLFPFTYGCHITFLTRTPSPQIIMRAFAEVRPALILAVPLVIEKIYKNKILPTLKKPMIQALSNIPGVRSLIYGKIRKQVYEAFGGNFKELIIGGAAFNPDVERFFKTINFPFTVGYGMTECGPLVSYASWDTIPMGSCGKPVDALHVRIDSEDPYNEVGEIMIKGSHVMDGYYKNPEATAAVLENDGWLHSGDLGIMDENGYVYIKGRSKSMILGPSGQNIYPEELEAKLNNLQYIQESLIVERGNRLTALIYPDYEYIDRRGWDQSQIEKHLTQDIKHINAEVPNYMQMAKWEIWAEEFEKTPKKSIKRFMYK